MFSVMTLYLKLSFTVPAMNSGYDAQFDHLILFFIYNTDYFSKLLFSFELFVKQRNCDLKSELVGSNPVAVT